MPPIHTYNKMLYIYSITTSAVAQHWFRPNKLNWTHYCKNKFTFFRFLYSLSHPYHHQLSFYVCCRLCCTAQCPIQITIWGCFHFLIQCDIPISGFGSFCMGPLNGAVIKEFWGKVLYPNPVYCVAVCSQHTPLPGPFLWLYR